MTLAAFPGAHGWGATATGGRGGFIRVVSNTNDAGAGSFRAAVSTDGPAIIVFTTGGVVTLASQLEIIGSDLTIAGQTAPGGGFTFDGTSSGHRLFCRKDNLIIRYLSFRESRLALFGTSDGCHTIMVDHCSFCWGRDDMLDMWYSDSGETWPDVYNVTIQNSLFAQPLTVSNKSMIAGGGTGGDDSLADHIHDLSCHSNLFANVGWRNPFFKCASAEVINNVVYNFSFAAGMSGENDGAITDKSDWIANRWVAGNLETQPSPMLHYPNQGVAKSEIYLRANITSGVYPSDIMDPTADNWPLVRKSGDYTEENTDQKRTTQLTAATIPVPEISAAAAYSRVPAWAGNIHRLESDGTWTLRRDSFDQDQLDDVEADNGGIADLPASAGSMPSLSAGTAYTDTDGDGMADDWEDLNGLNKASAADQNAVSANGYTNIENFLNGMQLLGHGGPRAI